MNITAIKGAQTVKLDTKTNLPQSHQRFYAPFWKPGFSSCSDLEAVTTGTQNKTVKTRQRS